MYAVQADSCANRFEACWNVCRHVQAQFVDKNTDRSDRALAVWDLGVRLFKLRRRDEARFAVMRRLHRLPNHAGPRLWKQAIDIDFEAESFHPALGHRMTVSGAEEVRAYISYRGTADHL